MRVSFNESQYLKASDVPRPVTAEIISATEKLITPDKPPQVVVCLRDLVKPLVLNLTNGRVLEDLYGQETDDWHGKSIEVFPAITSFEGRKVPCIRLRPPSTPQPPVKAPAVDVPNDA